MIQIKLTQTVKMEGDEKKVSLVITDKVEKTGEKISTWVEIPMKSVFQVKRGLESYVQKFYRKHDKKSA